jgi:signal transduction histidine kinase
VQEIVVAHGGHIAVQSTPGRGTTFTITLPIEPPLQADAPG